MSSRNCCGRFFRKDSETCSATCLANPLCLGLLRTLSVWDVPRSSLKWLASFSVHVCRSLAELRHALRKPFASGPLRLFEGGYVPSLSHSYRLSSSRSKPWHSRSIVCNIFDLSHVLNRQESLPLRRSNLLLLRRDFAVGSAHFDTASTTPKHDIAREMSLRNGKIVTTEELLFTALSRILGVTLTSAPAAPRAPAEGAR